jgi:uncharacterized protein
MDAPEALREFLTYVVANLIDHPKEATIASGRNASGGLVFRVMLAPDDVRLVHGRNGMTASAIRSLLQTAAERHGLKVSLKIGSVRDEEGGESAGAADTVSTDDATAES